LGSKKENSAKNILENPFAAVLSLEIHRGRFSGIAGDFRGSRASLHTSSVLCGRWWQRFYCAKLETLHV